MLPALALLLQTLVILATLGLCAARPAQAQSPVDRAALAAWDDSLNAVTSIAALARYETKAHAGTGGTGDIRLALYDLRRGELGEDRGVADLALTRLAAVSAAHAKWPWPDVIMARAFFARSNREEPVAASDGVNEGELHVEAGWRHLRYAINVDPLLPAGRRLAMDILVAEGDRELRSDEESVLHTIVKRQNSESDALLVWGRDLRTHKKYDSALTVFHQAVAAGGDRARLDVEIARTAHATGDTALARTAYWDGLAHLTSVGREMYRHDLEWIMAPDSLKEFDALPRDSVADWMHRFWDIRDAAAVNVAGERLQEHLRRWAYAFEYYRVVMPWRYNEFKRVEYGFDGLSPCVGGNDSELYDLLAREQPSHPGDVRHREPLLDHRGLIYLHHGEPVRRLYVDQDVRDSIRRASPPTIRSKGSTPQMPTTAVRGHVPSGATHDNEAWVYWVDGELRVFNFRGSNALGHFTPTTLTSYLPLNREDWLARASLSQEYSDAAEEILQWNGPSPCSEETVETAIKRSRADADVGTRTDSDTPVVPHPWFAVVQALALGSGIDQSSEALVTFAIPTKALHADTAKNGDAVYNVAARIVAYDRLTGRTAAIDTVRHIAVPARTAAKEYLSGWFEFALEPGDWQVGVRMQQPGDSLGSYFLDPHLTIDRGTTLALSDIVTGIATGASWPAPDNALFPVNVLRAWTVGGTAELYYEVRGLKADASYQTTIEIRPVDPKAKETVRVATTDRATGSTTAVRKSLGLERLTAGHYRLTVTVDANGQKATRMQDIVIVKTP